MSFQLFETNYIYAYRNTKVDAYSVQRPSFQISPQPDQPSGDITLIVTSTWLGEKTVCEKKLYGVEVPKNSTSMYSTLLDEDDPKFQLDDS